MTLEPIDLPKDFADSVAARSGPEFEAHLRAAGLSLPAGVSAADLLRAVFEARFQTLGGEEAAFLARGQQLGLSPIVAILRALEAELPEGAADPSFKDLLLERVKAWAAIKRHPGGPHLPNQRMKLSWRGGRLKRKRSILIAAAAPRSLCAIR